MVIIRSALQREIDHGAVLERRITTLRAAMQEAEEEIVEAENELRRLAWERSMQHGRPRRQ